MTIMHYAGPVYSNQPVGYHAHVLQAGLSYTNYLKSMR